MSTSRNIGSMRKAHALHNSLQLSQRRIVLDRGKAYGIGCDTDDYALKWQSLELKICILSDWIMDEPLDIDYVMAFMSRESGIDDNG